MNASAGTLENDQGEIITRPLVPYERRDFRKHSLAGFRGGESSEATAVQNRKSFVNFTANVRFSNTGKPNSVVRRPSL